MDNNMSNQPAEQSQQPQPQSEQPVQSQQPIQPQQPMPPQQPIQPQFQQMAPAPKPPKKPMSKSTKKKIIIISSIVGAVAVVGIALAIILPNVLRIDYSVAYNTAKDLKPKLYDIYQNSDCTYAYKYVGQKSTNNEEYAEYITGCIDAYSGDTDSLVTKLGDSDGVSRNSEIKTQFDRFKTRYDELPGKNLDSLKEKLDLYKLWHSYAVAVSGLNYSKSTDAEITAAANILINSGNDTLKTYGEGWLEKSLAAANAYREYNNNSLSLTGQLDKYKIYQDKSAEQEKYVKANKPDITSLIPLDLSGVSEMYSEFNKLYDIIARTYTENYNSGSGDCTEFFGEVYCD